MSIISDALKKAREASKENTAQKEEETALAVEQTEPGEAPLRMSLPRFYMYGGIAVSGVLLFSGLLLFSFTRQTPVKEEAAAEKPSYVVPASATAKREEAPKPAADTSAPAPVTSTEVSKAINLNGIMYTPKKALAVINDSIWAVGDCIGKFKIQEIGKDFVKVVSGRQEFEVKLKR